MNRIKIFAVIFLILGPVFTYMGWQEKQKAARIAEKGVTVPGIITGGEWRSGRKRGKTYKFDVSYKSSEGREVQRNFTVTSDFFNKHVIGDAISDEKVEVRYVPGTDDIIVVGGSDTNEVMFIIGLVVTGVCLAACVYFFVLKKG